MLKTQLQLTMEESFVMHSALIDVIQYYKKLSLDGIDNDKYFHRNISENTKYFVMKYNTSRRLLKKVSETEWSAL